MQIFLQNSEVVFFPLSHYTFCKKCLEKTKIQFLKNVLFGGGEFIFTSIPLYIFKILPHQNSGWTSVHIFRKIEYFECFIIFLKLWNSNTNFWCRYRWNVSYSTNDVIYINIYIMFTEKMKEKFRKLTTMWRFLYLHE